MDVDLGGDQAGLEPGLCQQVAVLGDHVVAHVDQIGGGLAVAGVGVDVGADETAALIADHVAAVPVLADGLITGGQVEDYRGAGSGQMAAGRDGHPQVLADLHADHQLRQLLAAEEEIRVHGDLLTAEGQLTVHALAGGKPAGLIELGVVGDVDLGYDAQNFAPQNHHGAAVQLIPIADGHAHGGEQVQIAGFVQNVFQRPFRTVEQGGLEEQVRAGVGGDAQLGQSQHLHALTGGLFHQSNDLLGVIHAVGHLDFRGAGGNFDKSVPHSLFLPCKQFRAFPAL